MSPFRLEPHGTRSAPAAMAAIIALIAASACGGSSKQEVVGTCVPGATQSCATPNCGGSQTCRDDGTWNTCDCADASGDARDTGPPSGAGGASGGSGVGGAGASGGAAIGGKGGTGNVVDGAAGGADANEETVHADARPLDAPAQSDRRATDGPADAMSSPCASMCRVILLLRCPQDNRLTCVPQCENYLSLYPQCRSQAESEFLCIGMLPQGDIGNALECDPMTGQATLKPGYCENEKLAFSRCTAG